MTLETLLTHPAVQALGRALLHFLWQGALMALLVWLIQRIAPPSAARLRYAAATLVMMAMPVALILTVGLGSRSAPAAPIPSVRRAIPLLPPASVLYTPSLPAPPPGISGWVVCGWLAGVFLLSIRASIGWVRAQRLKRHAQPASQELEQAFANLLRQLRISAPIRLCTSALVHVPAVIGWLRPYILLPVTALTGLSESQLRAILAHELAHIRRHDYLVNLLQTAIETALFYHPAVWWVGQQMRIEREHCCDDIAVAICGDAIEYAAALTELEEIRGRIPEPALAATGGNLLSRVRRLLGEPDRPSRSFGAIAAAALVVLISASAVVSLDAQPPQNKPPAEKKEGVAKSEKAANAKATTVVTVSETRELSSLIRDASPAKLDVDREIGKVQLALAQLGAGKPEQQVTSQGADLLLKLFDSAQDVETKTAALEYLAASNNPKASEKLLSVAHSDPNPELRHMAISYIGAQANSFEALASVFDHDTNPSVRMEALSYLGASTDPRATDKLFSIALNDPSPEIRRDAVSYLATRGEK